MRKALRKASLLFLSLLLIQSLAGCRAVKRIFIKPPPEGIVQESYTIRLVGYEQTVTVRATSEEIFEFISDLSNLELDYLEFDTGQGQVLKDKKPMDVGESLVVTMKMMGVGIKGRMVVVKKEEKRHWIVVDNPYGYMAQRWDFKPARDGTRLTLRMDYEVPEKGVAGQLGKIVDFAELGKRALADLDLAMARIQEHFDPSLNAEELVSMGIRGDPYEAFLQAHKASVWVDAKPDEVIEWLNRNWDELLKPELDLKPGCLSFSDLTKMPQGQVAYCPADFQFAKINTNVDTFLTWRQKGGKYLYRTYILGMRQIGCLDVLVSPEAGGSSVEGVIFIEIPEAASPGFMDMMIALTSIPRRLVKAMSQIKEGVEDVS